MPILSSVTEWRPVGDVRIVGIIVPPKQDFRHSLVPTPGGVTEWCSAEEDRPVGVNVAPLE